MFKTGIDAFVNIEKFHTTYKVKKVREGVREIRGFMPYDYGKASNIN